MRQWSTIHPEFAHLPRKFKVAFNGAREDRAATGVHDLAFDLYRDEAGDIRVAVKAGGGQGRTPRIADVIKRDLHWRELLNYSEAVLRVYNRLGRRDHIFKARIKIQVETLGADAFAALVEEEWAHLRGGPNTLSDEELTRVSSYFVDPPTEDQPQSSVGIAINPRFRAWARRNVTPHRNDDHAIVTISPETCGYRAG